ncbi:MULTISPECIES: IclR family transcriptional regulator [Streptosporangium]|uniref:DNA-binding IclR family transcriptional regulator n=1 Tax=Streptosporangium brasiliense TaxID=47480 RepID=A0ABT9R9K9_9ACTN|nr:IclR family transcriptional regulator [Streptosporangium brasiliense]MDP9865903.1 DNA-binding IclR family transcriptional regulator [Streptosporangium brasiliense]
MRAPTVTGKVMAILGAFLPGDARLTLTEICRRAELPPATGHRLVRELTDGGFVERLPDGSYRVGMRLWQIGAQAAEPRELRELALPYMEDLYAATRENVQLAVLRGDRALYVERLRGPTSVPIVSRVAGELPLHATAVGKVLLAFAGPETVERVLAGGLTAHTPSTVVDPVRLRAELREIQRTGVACTQEEMSLGTCSVAVPVRGPGDRVVAALSLVAWRHSADLRRLAPAVLTAAGALSRDLATVSRRR